MEDLASHVADRLEHLVEARHVDRRVRDAGLVEDYQLVSLDYNRFLSTISYTLGDILGYRPGKSDMIQKMAMIERTIFIPMKIP